MCCRNGELTPREHQVARLLAEGRPQREIAQRLVMSRRTVYKHVRRVRDKVGAGNVVEAAVQLARELRG